MLLKQTCQSTGLPNNRYFKEASLLVAFYHEFKLNIFLAADLSERAECCATVCLQDGISAIFTRSQNFICALVKNVFIDVANVVCTGQNADNS